MSAVFLKILNMSITAGWIILAVVALRFLLKKAPKWVRCALWGLAGLRLVFPFSIRSVLSLIPSAETVSPAILTSPTPAITSGIPAVNRAVNAVMATTFTPALGESVNPLQIAAGAAAVVWIIGMTAMLFYSVVSWLRLRKRLDAAVRLKDHVWQSERVGSPFILGLFRPRIYLPFAMSDEDMAYVLAHENAHLRRRDHLIKPFAFLLLSVYWFNPLVWTAYILLCRDIELACDESVIRDMGETERRDYSAALLACSVRRRSIAACPLAFGEVGVKERIKTVLNYRKPAFWIVVCAVAAIVAAAVCLLTNPKDREPSPSSDPSSLSTQPSESSKAPDGTETSSSDPDGTDPPPDNAETRLLPYKFFLTQPGRKAAGNRQPSASKFLVNGETLSQNPEMSRHLPLYHLESYDAFNQFLSDLSPYYNFDHSYGRQGFTDISELIKRYDASFFNTRSLFMISTCGHSSSVRHEIDGVRRAGSRLTIAVNWLSPSVLNEDVTGWWILVELDKTDLTGCTAFDAYVNSVYDPGSPLFFISDGKIDTPKWYWGTSLWSKEWDRESKRWSFSQGESKIPSLQSWLEEYTIPEYTRGGDFAVALNENASLAALSVLDEHFQVIRKVENFRIIHELPSGVYYLCAECAFRYNYVPEGNDYDKCGYEVFFKLIVP